MKKVFYLFSLLTLGIVLIFLYGGCSEETDPVAPTTSVATTTTTVSTTATATGVGSLPPGVSGAIGNTRVALYTDLNNWNLDITFAFTACDASGNYSIGNFVPGNYFMDAWKDNDNNGAWGSSGDYVWVFGSGSYPNYTLSEKSFPAGTPVVTNFEVFIVP
jgi:hypothetical protein